MATTKVSSLTALTSPDGAEELLINDGGTSKKITQANLLLGIDNTSADATAITIDSSENVGIGDTDPSEAKLSIDNVASGDYGLQIVQAQNKYGLYIDQNGDGNALYIDSASTGSQAIMASGKYGLRINQDISGGYGAYFDRNLAEAGSYPLVYIFDDHGSNTQPALKVRQDGAGYGLYIDQNGNKQAIYIDSESAGEYAIKVNSKLGIGITQDISGGHAAYFNRDLAEAGSYPLVNIVDDNASNTQPALKVQQDGAGTGLLIDQNGNEHGISILTDATAGGHGIYISAGALTTGKIAYFYSNSAYTDIRNLVDIRNDNALATGTTALYVQQDSTGAAAVFDGGNVGIGTDDPAKPLHISNDSTWAQIRLERPTTSAGTVHIGAGDDEFKVADSAYALRLTVATDTGDTTIKTGNLVIGTAGKGIDFSAQTSADSVSGVSTGNEVLDHYEEGTWTPDYALATPGDSSWTPDRQYGRYTKIGRQVFFQFNIRSDAYSNTTGSGNLHVTGLPFATESTNYTFRSVCIYAASFAADNNPRTAVLLNNASYIILKKRADANDDDTSLDENSCTDGANKNGIYAFGSYYV